jgi:hypothetical protein
VDPATFGIKTPHSTDCKEIIMTNKDLGIWTADSSALVLIDYHHEMFEVIRSESDAEMAELNVRLLAKMAKHSTCRSSCRR